jgi:hypothetical protein
MPTDPGPPVKAQAKCGRCGEGLYYNSALPGMVHVSIGIGPCPNNPDPEKYPAP